MIDLLEISSRIRSANTIIDDMIIKAKSQGAKNFDMLLVLKDGLNELSDLLVSRKGITNIFAQKWDGIMVWVPRVFEDHPLLKIIRDIDNVVINNKL